MCEVLEVKRLPRELGGKDSARKAVDAQLIHCVDARQEFWRIRLERSVRSYMSSWEVSIYPKADGEPLINFKEYVHFRKIITVWRIY